MGQIWYDGRTSSLDSGAPQLHLFTLGMGLNPSSWKILLRKFIHKASRPRERHSGTGACVQVVLFVFQWDMIFPHATLTAAALAPSLVSSLQRVESIYPS